MRILKTVGLIGVLSIAGCSSMPGAVSTHQSDFDGTREVSMEPAPVTTPGEMVVFIQLGAHWTSKEPDSVSLIAQTPQEVQSIKAEEGLQFNIGGDVTSLSSSVTFTEHSSEVISGTVHTESSRPFTASMDFVEQLAEAETAGVRMRVGQDEYYEARMQSEGMNSRAHDALNDFLDELDKQKRLMAE